MKTLFTFIHFLMGAALWGALLLTLIWLLLPKSLRAEDATAISTTALINDRPSNSALTNADRDYRIGLMLNYLRQQAPALIPGLPDTLRRPVHFMIGQIRTTEDKLGFGNVGDETGDTISSFLSPAISLIVPTDASNPEALWFSPDYHHAHGIMPFNDAIMMGFTYHNAFSSNHVKLDVHPYYAQSWHSMDGYWGIETALGIGQEAGHPWGRLVIHYSNGNSDLMDNQQHGLDMHADYSFNDYLTFSAGMQKENDELGNYMLFRWKIELGR